LLHRIALRVKSTESAIRFRELVGRVGPSRAMLPYDSVSGERSPMTVLAFPQSQGRRHFFQPFVVRPGVRAELLDVAFALVVKDSPVEAERAGIRRVDQASRVALAHLEDKAHLEFAEAFSAQKTGDVVIGVDGSDDMQASRWTVCEEVVKGRGRAGRRAGFTG